MYTVTFCKMDGSCSCPLLTANVDKKCEFTRYLEHVLTQLNVQIYMESLPIDQAQCDHQAGWRNFSLAEFGGPPNICSTHLTGQLYYSGIRI